MQHTATRGHADTGTPIQEAVTMTAPTSASPRTAGAASRPDVPGLWLGAALAALGVLAGAAGAVSFDAQYQMVRAVKHIAVVAGLEAAIPDAAAAVFAAMGIALALHGRRAVRVRVLNLAAVGTSVAMNALAAGHGWRDLAVWVMPPVAYALASDTAIDVVRARARLRHPGPADLADEATPLALIGGVALWLLRLALAPVSTLSAFRAWVTGTCPPAPARPAPAAPVQATPALPAAPGPGGAGTPRQGGAGLPGVRAGSKSARFLDLVTARYGPLAAFPLTHVSRVCTELAPAAGLHAGAARAVLRRHVLAAKSAATVPVVPAS
jgi:hypothetical protein